MNKNIIIIALVTLSFNIYSMERKQLFHQFGFAIAEHNIEKLKKIISTYAEYINCITDVCGNTPIHQAVRTGNEQLLKLLIDNAGTNNVKNSSGKTPLYLAVQGNNVKIARLLLDNRADINTQEASGDTPLHWAAMKGNKEIVELLLTYGANFNAKNNYSQTPLFLAINTGNKEIIKLLLNSGSDVNAQDDEKKTPLWRACVIASLSASNADKEILELLIASGANVNAKNNSIPPLFGAGTIGVAEFLIAKGAIIHTRKPDGDTLLHHFVICDNKEMILFYLDKGVDKNIANNRNETAADLAQQLNLLEVTDLINSYMQVIKR